MSRAGGRRVFDVTKAPLRDADGTVYGILSSAREVTEMVLAEEALRASEARYRLLLDHAPVAVFVHDGTHVCFANDALAKIMGAPNAEALLGFPVAALSSADTAELVRERRREAAAGRVVAPPVELGLVTLDGRRVPVTAMATTCTFEAKAAVQVVLIDETARVKAQAEREAAEQQLRHAQRLDALGTLAGGIAHDFNNMLAVIAANTELARHELATSHATSPYLDEVLAATDRASALVRGILAFGRKQTPERRPLRLADVVRDAARLLRATLPTSIALDVEADPSGPFVVADAVQVHQALTNLVTNAWHAMSPARRGRILIAVETIVVDEATAPRLPDLVKGDYVCAVEKDNGSGMDESTRARAFDPFFTTKGPGEGTGLGLSVVYGIMREHGGTVTASSEVGAGSELRLYFPKATEPPAKAPVARTASAPTTTAARVLLVDDERAVLDVLGKSLERDGFTVTARQSLASALETLHAAGASFDVVVSDYNMPDGSGLDLAKAAKGLARALPVILMSGYLDARVQRDAAALGVDVLLAKPFMMSELTGAIARVLTPR